MAALNQPSDVLPGLPPRGSGWAQDGWARDGWAASGWLGPGGEQPWGPAIDPDEEEWLAGALAEAAGADRPGPWQYFVPGGLSRPGGRAGGAFAAGSAAEDLPVGAALADLAERAWAERERVSDDELIGLAQCWRRLSGWVAARELAAVAELAARREAQVAAGADQHLADHVSDEVAAALTLTGRAASRMVDLAAELDRLPATRATLETGAIDRARAAVIASETACLKPAHAAAVEAAVIARAPSQTTGQLRAAVRRAVLAADPAAADQRRAEAVKDARVEIWDEDAGTAALAGRDLPAADALAADRRIDTLARQLKDAGAAGTLASLRAQVFTALLRGMPLQALYPQQAGGADAATAGAERAATAGAGTGTGAASADGAQNLPESLLPPLAIPPLAGSVNLTLPLSTWLGGNAPGEAAGFGPLPDSDARALARLLAAKPGTRLCLTLTGRDGAALGHGCARITRSGSQGRMPELTFTISPLAAGTCDHSSQVDGYRPSSALCHRVITRQRRCSFPGCQRAAIRCDLDHTVPYDQGGGTCECNLSPLCRRHHRAKQAVGWHLDQPEPGIMVWRLPHGRSYRTGPCPYPGDGPDP